MLLIRTSSFRLVQASDQDIILQTCSCIRLVHASDQDIVLQTCSCNRLVHASDQDIIQAFEDEDEELVRRFSTAEGVFTDDGAPCLRVCVCACVRVGVLVCACVHFYMCLCACVSFYMCVCHHRPLVEHDRAICRSDCQ